MRVKSKCLVRGIFGLRACQKDDDGNVIPGTVRDLGTFDDMSTSEKPGGNPNLITDNGMELLKDSNFLNYIMVGSGSSTPNVTDTTLDSFVAGISLSTKDISTGPSDLSIVDYPWCSANVSKQFGKGAAAGNLSEVGIGKSQNNMFARALIKDSNGDPTTITVLPIEYLTVTYQWRVYWDLTYSHTDTFEIDSVEYTTTANLPRIGSSFAATWAIYGLLHNWPSRVYAYTGDAGNPGEEPGGAKLPTLIATPTAAPFGDFYVDYATHVGISNWNEDIKSFVQGSHSSGDIGLLKVGVSPALEKDNTKELNITIRFAWDRKVP